MQKRNKLLLVVVLITLFAGCTGEIQEQNKTESKKTGEKTIEKTGGVELREVPDTGQDKCYDVMNQINCPKEGEDFFGQDAQYLGDGLSYQDNGDGTVTDLNTDLMWVKAVDQKVNYYDVVSKEFSFAGYDDWRVPSVKELYSLMDFRGVDPDAQAQSSTGLVPFIDTDYFDFKYGDVSNGDRIIDSQWITSDIYVSKVMDGQECFFGVNFADGRIKCYPTRNRRNNGYYLRYVRGGEYGQNDFKSNGDGTVTDDATGLVWQQKDSEKGMNWQEALKYCEDLNLAGENDWRLPNVKELQHIVDYGKSPDTTDSAAIDSIFKVSEITNEKGQKDYPFFWSSTTHLNGRGAGSGAYVSFGRAMGYMNGQWMDVHGAGAQRSDPKTGDPADYPNGFGPQGDARRIYNYVRCVRGDATLVEVRSEEKKFNVPYSAPQNRSQGKNPPLEATNACENKDQGSSCSFSAPHGKITGICRNLGGIVACVPQH